MKAKTQALARTEKEFGNLWEMVEFSARSEFVSVSGGDEIHVRVFSPAQVVSDPVILVHGAVESGRIFYSSNNQKGLAPFLARQGHSVWVVDLRGRGQSRPATTAVSTHGQRETVLEDLPLIFQKVREIFPDRKIWWGSHSWGGVLVLAVFARAPEIAKSAAGYFALGAKRRVRAKTWQRWLMISLVWNWFCPWIARRQGYLNAARYKIGSDPETLTSLLECIDWVKSEEWVDRTDGFDYREALKKVPQLPALFLAGDKDRALGHPSDVKLLMAEWPNALSTFGLLEGYGHIDCLTSSESTKDVFPWVSTFVRSSRLK